MPIYAYKGVTASGKATRGSLNAENARAARARMRYDGIILTEISESAAPSAGSSGSTGDTRRLSLAWHQRIPGLERALVEQVEHVRLKDVLRRVRERVNEGAALADAISESRHFDELYVSMIRAGEAGGALELVLARIADYLEDRVRLQNKVTSVIVYPIVMLVFALLVVVALVTVVLPQITSLLLSLDQPLPW